MASTQRFFSQPLTRNFVNTQDVGQGEQGPYFFTQGDIDSWAADNSDTVTKIGSVFVISAANFVSVTENLNHSNPTIDSRKTLKDMGKDVIIGTPSQARLLVLRKVQQYSPASAANGSGDPALNGYVVVENNTSDLGGNGGRFMVKVARI